MRFKIPSFFNTKNEHVQHKIHKKLKKIPCPECKRTGCLIWNGCRFGGPEHNDDSRVLRGFRVFCSNRYKNLGCGKSFTVFLSHILPKMILRANTLWSFLRSLMNKTSLHLIFKQLHLPFSSSSAFRLRNKLKSNLSHIRSRLISLIPIPPSSESMPELQSLQHLLAAFTGTVCPVAAFQLHFQQPFFNS